MSAIDVCEALNISRSTLGRLIKGGVIKPVENERPRNPLLKRSRRYHFRPEDVEALKPKPAE